MENENQSNIDGQQVHDSQNLVPPPIPRCQQAKAKKPKKAPKPVGFGKIILGSAIGFIIGSLVISIFSVLYFVMALGALIGEETETLKDNSVLELTLAGNIIERDLGDQLYNYNLDFTQTSQIGLDKILASIEHAKTDDKIKGISLNLSSVAASPASLSEIRDAIIKFKQSGKFVYAYSDSYSQSTYYLASSADSIYMNPQGDVEWKGLAFQLMFYKGLLDKLDINVQVVKCGKFKSAVEPYILENMSEANREQMMVLAESLWGKIVKDISVSRNQTVEMLNALADSAAIHSSQDAFEYGLIDAITYRSNYIDILKNKLGIASDKSLNLITLDGYSQTFKLDNSILKKQKIAVIYATGEIIDGRGDESTIGSQTLCKEIRRAYTDKEVKAIVLRVNSPGGSALASEVIWNEIERAKAAGVKVVTSMGDYAASGGYYISCNSDAIVAQDNTLTGSIGVFGLIPNLGNCLKNKLGITIDVAKSNIHSDAYTGLREMDEQEYNQLQKSVDRIYDTFLQRVSEGRNIDKAQVDSIGQGRVWTGSDALQHKLVDKIGTLQDAINLAVELSGASDYNIVYYPKHKSWIEQLFASPEEDNITAVMKAQMGELYYSYAAIKQITNMQGIQARMPMELIIK